MALAGKARPLARRQGTLLDMPRAKAGTQFMASPPMHSQTLDTPAVLLDP